VERENEKKYFNLIKQSAQDAPRAPGCYIMRGEDSGVIYVGKAKVLRKRLLSYFSGVKDVKTTALLRRARSIETIIVSNEYEALLLENTLIKQYSPKYNISLKDGKSYPVIRVTHEDFPRIFKTRVVIEDGSRYFGPYANVHAMDSLIEIIDKLFTLRKCKRLKKKSSPCMYYHIKRCKAPCAGKISVKEYGRLIERAERLLEGETDGLVIDLTKQMHECARKQNFEQAAYFRDCINAITESQASNSVVDFDPQGRDYIALSSSGLLTSFSVFMFRSGRLTGRELYSTRSAAEDAETLITFITSYYNESRQPAPRIILPADVFENIPEYLKNQMYAYFNNTFLESVIFCKAQTPQDSAVINMVALNAKEDLQRRLNERGKEPALLELKTVLSLPQKPSRIEGFDIAQLDGKHPVASLISFKDGRPDKKNYRLFKLKTVVGVVDDFAAMREAVRRRYSRLLKEKSPLPDLILVDGGIGQVNAAAEVLNELKINVPIAGLAKRDEEIYTAGSSVPIRLSRQSEALKTLQAVRDETHRFATTLNQKLRSKDLCFSVLESVEGIGKERAMRLIKTFSTLDALSLAEPEEIAEKCGLNLALAKHIRAACRLAVEDKQNEIERLKKLLN
jgi:excinuclease ABC subunit C